MCPCLLADGSSESWCKLRQRVYCLLLGSTIWSYRGPWQQHRELGNNFPSSDHERFKIRELLRDPWLDTILNQILMFVMDLYD
jgi:hypothetical protein